jgi:hypothetical protein
MITRTIKRESILLAIYACLGLLFFPIGFLWFSRRRVRPPQALLVCTFLVIILNVISIWFYIIYPES